MIFNDSKYTRWYDQIIEQAKVRSLSRNVYTERHHIIPQSFDGYNSVDNMVQTPEHIEKRKCSGSKNGRFGYKMLAQEIAQRTATMRKNKLAKKIAKEI